MKIRSVVFLLFFVVLLSGCATYLGRPETPNEDRAELALEIGIMLLQFDDRPFDVPPQGTVSFEAGEHVLYVTYTSSRGGSGFISTEYSKPVGIKYSFGKGKKYQMQAVKEPKYGWVMSFNIVEI